MNGIPVTHIARIPDPIKISRYAKVPELGPNVLFFSGGSALNGISRVLKKYTHNSTHLVTPFDSGGSSAKLREAFDMPAIGDLRSRLMALADESITGHPEIYRLFTYRLSAEGTPEELAHQLDSLVRGKEGLLDEVANPMRRLICNQLGYFFDAMPKEFDLRGASIGNLILAGGYLNNHQHLDPIIFLFSKLVNVQGTVRAIVNDNLHLGAELEDGSRVIGQHRLTGKETAPLASPVRRLFLSKRLDEDAPVDVDLRKKNRKLIARADLICYPPGSFYTSLIANLLPQGAGSAIAANGGPKVYVPNLGRDPEQLGMDGNDLVKTLLKQLRRDAPKGTGSDRLLNFILLDSKNGDYPGTFSGKLLKETGIRIIDTRLISKQSAPYYDAELLVSALLSLT
ncbi:MAG: GAK system CofD-like protein [Pseudomonadota bacterium]